MLVIWNIYRKQELITVILKDGNTRKLNRSMISLLSYLCQNGYNINKAITFLADERLEKNQLDQLLLLIDKGIKLNEALIFLKENKISYKNSEISMNGWLSEGVTNSGDIVGIFVDEDYKFLNVKNEIVIDVGANIGDSSIYFAVNGAKKVIALEPYPFAYNYALKNIESNHLAEKITLLNAGYGEDSEIIVDENKKTDLGTDLVPSDHGKRIKIYSLKTLTKIYDLNDGLILKMDCEGCEYSLLSEDNSTLRKFKRIQIEYHYGHKKLIKKLKACKFNLTHTEPRKVYVESASKSHMRLGWIYAEK